MTREEFEAFISDFEKDAPDEQERDEMREDILGLREHDAQLAGYFNEALTALVDALYHIRKRRMS